MKRENIPADVKRAAYKAVADYLGITPEELLRAGFTVLAAEPVTLPATSSSTTRPAN